MTYPRRAFLVRAAAFGALAMTCRPALARPAAPEPDEEIFRSALRHAGKWGWTGRPVGEVVALMGQRFLAAPYVAHSLEADGPERLIVNLREFDCTTFLESMLALARCVRTSADSFADLESQLRLIRYRSGLIDGYPSRLHYFTDWIADNARKGTVTDLTRTLGGTARTSRISFMSDHPGSYRQLGDPATLEAIRTSERELSAAKRWFIPRNRVQEMENSLSDGDLIGVTTSVDGLDVAHTGMIVVRSGRRAFLHASLSGNRVELADGTLSTYLQKYRTHDGIMVARPREPELNERPR
jgi:hypothetical protein